MNETEATDLVMKLVEREGYRLIECHHLASGPLVVLEKDGFYSLKLLKIEVSQNNEAEYLETQK